MKKYKGLEILPGTEDDLLTVRIDIDRPVLARICESEVMRYEDGTPVKTVLKLMVDTTGGYRYLYLDVDDPEWTSPITGMIYVRAYENHVRLDDTEEIQENGTEEMEENGSEETWKNRTEELGENETQEIRGNENER